MSYQNYRDLIAWQQAMALVVSVYEVSMRLPRAEQFGLAAQMRRAAVAVPANIAEGEGRRTDGEFLNQLSVAHGSLRELETHLTLSVRLRMLDDAAVQPLLDAASTTGRVLSGLMRTVAARGRRRNGPATCHPPPDN